MPVEDALEWFRMHSISSRRQSGHCVLGFVMALVLSSCTLPDLALPSRETATPTILSQWAMGATASSSYAFPDWSPNRAAGAPEVSTCVDDPRAWASARGNGVEWLELSYPVSVYPDVVRIHQTYGRGAISRVSLLDDQGVGVVIWEGVDALDPCPGVLEVQVQITTTLVSTLRIDLDESRTGGWNQIDAVELVGSP